MRLFQKLGDKVGDFLDAVDKGDDRGDDADRRVDMPVDAVDIPIFAGPPSRDIFPLPRACAVPDGGYSSSSNTTPSATRDIQDHEDIVVSDLRRQLAARDAAIAAYAEEAARQASLIEDLEAALAAEKTRGTATQAQMATLNMQVELERQRSEEMASGMVSAIERGDAAVKECDTLRKACDAAIKDRDESRAKCDAIADQLASMQQRLSKAEATAMPSGSVEAEVVRLRVALREAEMQVEALQSQQLRLNEGIDEEFQLRDAQIAALKQDASKALPNDFSEDYKVLEFEKVFESEGTIGLEFVRMEPPWVVESVLSGSHAEGHFSPGDHLLEVAGISANDLIWPELVKALSVRPIAVKARPALPGENTPNVASALGAKLGGWGRSISGWTKEVTVRAVDAVKQQLEGENEPTDLTDALPSDLRNQPFFKLVRDSMVEILTQKGAGEEAFEMWLRDFHNERDDGWYQNNHWRVWHAFRPHWDEEAKSRGLSLETPKPPPEPKSSEAR